MSRILFAWELGGNYGHLSKLLPLARLLRQRGHEPAFVVRDLAVASVLIGNEFTCLQTPRPPDTVRQPRVPVSYADILSGAGFGNREALSGMLHAWQGLFDLVKPDVVVAQFAPVAIVAARQASRPTLQVDTGFECPPAAKPYPNFRPWVKIARQELLDRENALLQTVNAVCGWNDADLRTTLRPNLSLLATLPELDHYPGRRGGRYIGPFFALEQGDELFWNSTTDKRIFTYLRPFPELSTLLNDLRQSQAEVIAVIPGIDRKLANSFTADRFRIVSAQARLDKLLPQADVVVSHGGHGLTSACLLQGVPSLAIPTMIEQWMTARNLERLKIGLGATRAALRKQGCRDVLNSLLTNMLYKKNAAVLATKYQDYDQQKTISRLALTIERMAESKQKQIEVIR